MAQVTRRNFLEAAGTAGLLGALAACDTTTPETPAITDEGSKTEPEPADEPQDEPEVEADPTLEAPDADAYPIDADGDDVEAKWTMEDMSGWYRYTADGAPTVGLGDESRLIQVDGFAFRDLNGNGKLDFWEDWRQTPEDRAAALAKELSREEIVGLMGYPGTFTDLLDPLSDSFKTACDYPVRSMQNGQATARPTDIIQWSNKAQAYAEGSHFGIPIDFCCDPRNTLWGINITPYPDNLALAATFNPDMARTAYMRMAQEYRAQGISTLLGPQVDLATDPRWGRNAGAFGADPALARDMTRAATDAFQSTWDEDGNDLGWGEDSVLVLLKHFPGDGPGESGRESHDATGQFNVYPGRNFYAGTVAFIDGGLHLPGKTQECSGFMPSYSVAYTEDEEYGELVGSGFSKFKLGLLRDERDYDGVICTDWGIEGGKIWGVEDLTVNQRIVKAYDAGVDQMGGSDDRTQLLEVFDEIGEDRMRKSAERLIRGRFRINLFENPYFDRVKTKEYQESAERMAEAWEMQEKTVVMLKNENDAIYDRTGEDTKPKVYVPLTYSKGVMGFVATNVSLAELMVDEDVLSEAFEVVTDTVGEPSGDIGDDGNPEILYEDIKRASKEELADCDFALVFIRTPKNTTWFSITGGVNQMTGEFIPLSLQYKEYTADGPNVRKQSIAGRLQDDGTRENQTYFGKTASVDNMTDLDMINSTIENMPEGKPVIVCINAEGRSPVVAAVVNEFEDRVDSILYGLDINFRAFVNIAAGKVEPYGLLPIQIPADMDTVEANYEDVPRDCECHVDTAGNIYDFAFGLNWSGVIDDDRVATYKKEPLTEPEF